MKTKTKNPKIELLLGAGLNVLHQESREWLSTVAFWKDETRFFTDLLNKREINETEYGKMLKNLDPKSKGWDGLLNGNPLPQSGYWFKVLFRDDNGVLRDFKAHFTLKR